LERTIIQLRRAHVDGNSTADARVKAYTDPVPIIDIENIGSGDPCDRMGSMLDRDAQ
jgi:hypothetical protein